MDEDCIRRLEAQVGYLYRHLGLDPAAAIPAAAGAVDADVAQLISSGRKIHAVKLYRERTGAGLAEAKDAVEAYERRYRLG
jgi:large subunit ribosomal protein L7/L12